MSLCQSTSACPPWPIPRPRSSPPSQGLAWVACLRPPHSSPYPPRGPPLAPSLLSCLEPKVLQAREPGPCRLQQEEPQAVLVGYLGAVYLGFEDQPFSVSASRWCRFLPLTFLPPSYPRSSPPTPVVFASPRSRRCLRSGAGPTRADPQDLA